MAADRSLSERVLDFLRDEAGRPLKTKELARELGIPDEEYPALRTALRELEAEGLLYRGRKGRYSTPRNINLVVGRLQVTRAGDGFVVVEDGEQDVFVRGRNLHTAVEGDRVVARIEHRRPGRNPEGQVIRVLDRAWRQVVGTYHRKHAYGFVLPQEPPLRGDLFIPPGFEDDARDGDIVLVRVLEWGERELSPVGQIERILGSPGDPGVDVLAIILGNQLPLEFAPEVAAEAERIAAAGVEDARTSAREDLRDRLVITIDPADARDHDDAVSFTRLESGGAEVGIHIADVSHYVAEGSALDREALERGTSVYLVDRVVPMLPHALSSDLCSLKPDVDRLAVSLLLRVGSDGHVRDHRLVRSVIRSRHRLSYDEAQLLLDDPGAHEDGIGAALVSLLEFTRRLRAERVARGSIDFDLPEARVVLNPAGEPTDIQRVLRLPAHELIEDLMILANETVAALSIRERVPIVFRVHEPPDADKIEALRALASTFGFRLPPGSVKPRNLARMLRAMDGTPQEQLMVTATLRSMKQARYATENLEHFGLASPAYAHFTSPIRRYPDLIVHRQLSRWLTDPAGARRVDREGLGHMARHASDRERRAMAAERDSIDLKKIEFMERHLGEEFEGTIAGVTAFGLFVLLDDFQVDGLVHVSSLTDDYYVFVEERHALVGRRGRNTYQLGDRARVQVARVDREERHIDFELLEHAAMVDEADGGRRKQASREDDRSAGPSRRRATSKRTKGATQTEPGQQPARRRGRKSSESKGSSKSKGGSKRRKKGTKRTKGEEGAKRSRKRGKRE